MIRLWEVVVEILFDIYVYYSDGNCDFRLNL